MAKDIYGTAVGMNKDTKSHLETMDKLFRLAISSPIRQAWVQKADRCWKFYHGDMWTQAERAILEKRSQADIVENEIKPMLRRLMGRYKTTRTVSRFVGRNMPADDVTAQAISDLVTFVEQDNSVEFEEAEYVKDAFVTGIGWCSVTVRKGANGLPRIVIQREDPFSIFKDPYSHTYDINTDRGGARYCGQAKWLHIDEAIATWPDYEKDLLQCLDGTYMPASFSSMSLFEPEVLSRLNQIYTDKENRLIRPVELWYKKRVKKNQVITPFGAYTDIPKDKVALLKRLYKGQVEERSTMEDRMHYTVFCGGIMIEEDAESPYRHNMYPWTPLLIDTWPDGEPIGYVWDLIDPNREINARRARGLYLLNNRQVIYERGAVESKESLARELALADGQIELEEGALSQGRFSFRENTDQSQGNINLMLESKAAIRRIGGEDFIEPPRERASAPGLRQQAVSTQLTSLEGFDNIRRTRRLRTLLVYEYIKQYFTDEMNFMILDSPTESRLVSITSSQFDTIKEKMYDLVMKDSSDYITRHEAQFESIMQTLPQVLQFGPAWARLLIMMSDVKDKEAILKFIDENTPQQGPEGKFTLGLTWHELTQQEKAAFAAKLGLPELAQVVAAESKDPVSVAKGKTEMLKTQLREGLRAAMEDGRRNQAAEQFAVDAFIQLKQQQDDAALARVAREQGNQSPIQGNTELSDDQVESGENIPEEGAGPA